MKSKKWILTTAFAAALSMAGLGMAQAPATAQVPAAGTDQAKATTKMKAVKAAPAPTEQEITDAKAKGLVWVNTTAKVYHKEGALYGKTKRGKFMTEEDAKQAGYKTAKEHAAKQPKSTAKATAAAKA
jgi:hypothetical protein